MDAKKLIFILIVLLIIVILISILSLQRVPKTPPVSQKAEQAGSSQITEPLLVQPQAPMLSPPPPAITMIKKTPAKEKEKQVRPAPIARETREETSASTASRTGGSQFEETYKEEPKADIVKKPAPEKIEEMKAKGIILY